MSNTQASAITLCVCVSSSRFGKQTMWLQTKSWSAPFPIHSMTNSSFFKISHSRNIYQRLTLVCFQVFSTCVANAPTGSCSSFDPPASPSSLPFIRPDSSVCLYRRQRLGGGWKDNSVWYFFLSSSALSRAVCTVINWAGGVSMALSYFGLKLGSLTLAACLAWILSSHFWSQAWFNLENLASSS